MTLKSCDTIYFNQNMIICAIQRLMPFLAPVVISDMSCNFHNAKTFVAFMLKSPQSFQNVHFGHFSECP